MRCYRKILHISYKDHVNNEEVRAKIQQAIGPHEDLLTISEGSGEQGQLEKTGCEMICGAPTTHAIRGVMMMMMMSRFDDVMMPFPSCLLLFVRCIGTRRC